MYEVFPLFRPIAARPLPRIITTVIIAGSGTGARFSVNEAMRACVRACVPAISAASAFVRCRDRITRI